MAKKIATERESTFTAEVGSNPQIIQPAPPRVEVNSTEVDRGPIRLGLSGMKWQLDEFYQQLLGKNNEPKALDINASPVNQQYTNIKNLEIVVTSALSPNQDEDSKEFTLEGTADIYAGLSLNVGDMFIAKHADSKKYLLTVTKTRKLADTLDSAMEINFKVVDILKKEHIDNLKLKTVKTYYWVKENINHNLNPMLTEGDYGYYVDAITILEELPKNYIDEFYNLEYGFLCLPNMSSDTIDPALTNFVTDLFASDVDYRVAKLQRTAQRELETSILDTVTERNPTLRIKFRSNIESTRGTDRLDYLARQRSFRFGSASNVVLAASVGNLNTVTYSEDNTESVMSFADYGNADYSQTPYSDNVTRVRTLTPMNDKYYIFPSEFYLMEDELPTFELVLMDYIKGVDVDTKVLIALYNDIQKLNQYSRFYYLPLIYIMLVSSLGGSSV